MNVTPPKQNFWDEEAPGRPDGEMSPAKGELEVWDYLIAALVWPVSAAAMMIIVGIIGAPSAEAAGAATAEELIYRFWLYALLALIPTYLVLRLSRSWRRRWRHDAKVRRARGSFYLDEAKKRGCP